MFHLGQKVVCVDANFSHPGWLRAARLPKEGEILTIRGFADADYYSNGELALYFEEILNGTFNWARRRAEMAYGAKRFRPLLERKTDILIFKKMLVPKQRELIE
jgi:hypothetical protein